MRVEATKSFKRKYLSPHGSIADCVNHKTRESVYEEFKEADYTVMSYNLINESDDEVKVTANVEITDPRYLLSQSEEWMDSLHERTSEKLELNSIILGNDGIIIRGQVLVELKKDHDSSNASSLASLEANNLLRNSFPGYIQEDQYEVHGVNGGFQVRYKGVLNYSESALVADIIRLQVRNYSPTSDWDKFIAYS